MNGYILTAAIFSACGFGSAWKYQQHKIDAIKAAQTATLEKDARYAALQSKLSVSVSERQQATAATTANTAAAVRSTGLHVRAACPRVRDATAPASVIVDETISVKLSDADAEKLRSEAQRADEAADYARAGHDYAELIEKFIKENGK